MQPRKKRRQRREDRLNQELLEQVIRENPDLFRGGNVQLLGEAEVEGTTGEVMRRRRRNRRQAIRDAKRASLETARYLPFVGDAIDAAEIVNAASTGRDFEGGEASPEELSAMMAAGLLIPNVIERPARAGYRAIKRALRKGGDAFDYSTASRKVMDDYGAEEGIEQGIRDLRSSINDESEFTSRLISLSEQSPNSNFTFNIRGAEDPDAIRAAVRNAEDAGLIRKGSISLESRGVKEQEIAALEGMNRRAKEKGVSPEVYIKDSDGVLRAVNRSDYERALSGDSEFLSGNMEFNKNLSQYSDFGVTGGLPSAGGEGKSSSFILNRGSMSADPIAQRARYRDVKDESLFANQHNFLTQEQSPLIIESGGRGFAQTGDMTGREARRRARFEAPEYGKTPTQSQIRRGESLDRSVPIESEYPDAVYMRMGQSRSVNDDLIRRGVQDPSTVYGYMSGGKVKVLKR